MTLTLTHYDTTVRIEIDHDDVAMPEMWEALERLVLAAGYPAELVADYFRPEDADTDKDAYEAL